MRTQTWFEVEAQESLCCSNGDECKKVRKPRELLKNFLTARAVRVSERNNRGIKTGAPHLKYGTPRVTTGKQLGENCFNLCSPPACVQLQRQQEFRLTLSSSFKVDFPQTVVFWLTFSCRQCELRKKRFGLMDLFPRCTRASTCF